MVASSKLHTSSSRTLWNLSCWCHIFRQKQYGTLVFFWLALCCQQIFLVSVLCRYFSMLIWSYELYLSVQQTDVYVVCEKECACASCCNCKIHLVKCARNAATWHGPVQWRLLLFGPDARPKACLRFCVPVTWLLASGRVWLVRGSVDGHLSCSTWTYGDSCVNCHVVRMGELLSVWVKDTECFVGSVLKCLTSLW